MAIRANQRVAGVLRALGVPHLARNKRLDPYRVKFFCGLELIHFLSLNVLPFVILQIGR